MKNRIIKLSLLILINILTVVSFIVCTPKTYTITQSGPKMAESETRDYIATLDNWQRFWEEQRFSEDRVAKDIIDSFNSKCDISGEILYNNIGYSDFLFPMITRIEIDYTDNETSKSFEFKGVEVEGNSDYVYSNTYFNTLEKLIKDSQYFKLLNKTFERQDNGVLKVTCNTNTLSLYVNYKFCNSKYNYDSGYRNTKNELITSIQQMVVINNFKFSFYVEMNPEEGFKINGNTYSNESFDLNRLLFNKSNVKVMGYSTYSTYPFDYIDINKTIDITDYLG